MEVYWELFWETGAPIFYLLYRRQEEASEAKTAWKEAASAAEV